MEVKFFSPHIYRTYQTKNKIFKDESRDPNEWVLGGQTLINSFGKTRPYQGWESNIKAIAVSMGPEHSNISELQELARVNSVPAIPINSDEAKVLANRLEFPYLTLLSTQQLTQIVLTKGVGNHTIFGINLDQTLEKIKAKFELELSHSLSAIKNLDQQVKEFTQNYNSIINEIPDGWFDTLNVDTMARYGDPTIFEMPTVMKTDISCDLSFTGFQTYAIGLLFEPNDPLSGISVMRQLRPRRELSFRQLVNLSASFQFALFSFIEKSMYRAIEFNKNDITGVNIAGVDNPTLKLHFERIAKIYGRLPIYSNSLLGLDAQIGWAAWEILNAGEQVDVSNIYIKPLERIPLGNYSEQILNIKNTNKIIKSKIHVQKSTQEKVDFMNRLEQQFSKANDILK